MTAMRHDGSPPPSRIRPAPSSSPHPASAPVIPSPAPTGSAHPPPGTVRSEATAAHSFDDFKRSVLTDLFTHSLILLAAFTALAALLAWWFSRRSLRRLGHVAEATARINNGNHLGERLALTGPHDEVGRLGDTVDAMLERLEQSFTAQRRFTAQASHELRTPLTIQRTALEIPLSQGRVPADLEPALRTALDATTRSENLLAALLTLARGESGLATARPTDLADTARTALADLRTEITERDIHVRTQLNPAPVTGDPALLAQLALNLLANAVRHNHPGGHVHPNPEGGLTVRAELGSGGPVKRTFERRNPRRSKPTGVPRLSRGITAPMSGVLAVAV
ncbi:HAMP domain-containing protein [Streptomyces eurocidicus]|nr:HAMP domain-containing protein [Streptomyces eurocidicus]